jgi:dTDP-4-amino-4,6-dideoxygalactose transaminase
MPEWRVPLSDVIYEDDEIAAVADTYRSGWITMGPRTQELEDQFAEYTGAAHAIAVTNCTAALHLSCLAAGLEDGDEVIVPSLTFVATVNAIRYAGATPVFADVAGLETPWLSAAAAEELIGERTKAIMTMTYGGHPGETVDLAALAAERGLILLEDAAHGLGGRVDGRHLGTFGLAGAFSFFGNKNLPIGEGGMVVTDDEAFADRLRLLRSHGMTSLTWDRHRGHAQGYDVVALGFNYRIDEPRAALASARLARLDADNGRRGELVESYREQLSGVERVTPVLPPMPGAEPAHHLFAVVLDEGIDRDGVRQALAEEGIQTSMHYPPVDGFSIYAAEERSLPVTDAYAERAVTLPLFPHMSESQLELVVTSLADAVA